MGEPGSTSLFLPTLDIPYCGLFSPLVPNQALPFPFHPFKGRQTQKTPEGLSWVVSPRLGTQAFPRRKLPHSRPGRG